MSLHLTAGEFELMDVLWSLGEGSVREIWQRVSSRRKVAYTTVMTTLGKMHQKGAVHQKKKGKAFRYRPAVTCQQVRESVIDDLIQSYFGGSRKDFEAFVRGQEPAGSTAAGPPPGPPRSKQEPASPESPEPESPEMEDYLL